MGVIKKFVVKLLGKKIDGVLGKYGISKAKVVSIVGGLIIGYNFMAPQMGWPPVSRDILEFLAAVGLWTLRDGIDSAKSEAIRG